MAGEEKSSAGNDFQGLDDKGLKERVNEKHEVLRLSRLTVKSCELFEVPVCLREVSWHNNKGKLIPTLTMKISLEAIWVLHCKPVTLSWEFVREKSIVDKPVGLSLNRIEEVFCYGGASIICLNHMRSEMECLRES